jgi:hypothetical protein
VRDYATGVDGWRPWSGKSPRSRSPGPSAPSARPSSARDLDGVRAALAAAERTAAQQNLEHQQQLGEAGRAEARAAAAAAAGTSAATGRVRPRGRRPAGRAAHRPRRLQSPDHPLPCPRRRRRQPQQQTAALQSELDTVRTTALRDVDRLTQQAKAADQARAKAERRYCDLVTALEHGGFTPAPAVRRPMSKATDAAAAAWAALLEVRDSDFRWPIAAHLVMPAQHTWVEVSRYRDVAVPLCRVGDLEDLREHPLIDWEEVRGVRPGRPSPLQHLFRRPVDGAAVIRRGVAEVGDRFHVEMWA